LGNTYVGCLTENNTLGPYFSGVPEGRPDGVAETVFVGCYAELGQPPSKVEGKAIFVGGQQDADFDPAHPGRRFASFSSPIQVSNRWNGINTQVGRPGVDKVALEWGVALGETYQLTYNYPNLDGSWAFVRAGSDPLLAFSGDQAIDWPQPRAILPYGYQIGLNVTGAIFVSTSSRILESGTRNEGDRYESPAAGREGYIGKICVRPGTAAPEWKDGQRYTVGLVVVPRDQPNNAKYYTCVSEGISGDHEPEWEEVPGNQFGDGTSGLVWRVGIGPRPPSIRPRDEPPALWQGGLEKKVGDRVVSPVPDHEFYYECIRVRDGMTRGRTRRDGPPPSATFLGEEVVDNEITWRCQGWRTQSALFKRYGPIT